MPTVATSPVGGLSTGAGGSSGGASGSGGGPESPAAVEYLITPAMHSSHLTSIRAEYADLAASYVVPRSMLKQVLTGGGGTDRSGNGGGGTLTLSTVIEDLDVSAHIVTATVSSDRPILQVRDAL